MAGSSTSKNSTTIPMRHPDGRPYEAETEVEAMELMSRGYTREDGGAQAPANPGAKAETKAAAEKPGS